MQFKGKTDLDSTKLWTKIFVHPPVLSAIYKNLLLKYDKKNNGGKQKSYFFSKWKICKYLPQVCIISRNINPRFCEKQPASYSNIIKKIPNYWNIL